MFDWCRQDVEAEAGVVVFRRWYLFHSKRLTICLHQFLRSDTWAPHNHEYDSISFILRGSYRETIRQRGANWFRMRLRKAWRPFYRRATDYHVITLPKGKEGKVWSLFFQFCKRGPEFPVGYLCMTGLMPKHGAGPPREFVPLAEYDRAMGHVTKKVVPEWGFLPRLWFKSSCAPEPQ